MELISFVRDNFSRLTARNRLFFAILILLILPGLSSFAGGQGESDRLIGEADVKMREKDYDEARRRLASALREYPNS